LDLGDLGKWPELVWGFRCQGIFVGISSFLASSRFFVRLESRFFAPACILRVRRAERRSRPGRRPPPEAERSGLDGCEHGRNARSGLGHLPACMTLIAPVDWGGCETNRGNPPLRARTRAAPLYSVLCHEGTEVPCCTKDEGGPFGAALQGEASNCHKLLWTQVRGGERYGKRRGSDHVKYGLERRAQANP